MSVNEEERKEQFKKIYDETYNNILRYRQYPKIKVTI